MFKSLFKLGLLIVIGSNITALKLAASSPQAWEQNNKEAIAKCRQASGLKDANIGGKIILFGDDVGYDGLIIKGRYPQAHMKNKGEHLTCAMSINA
jgi:hypothetical protein